MRLQAASTCIIVSLVPRKPSTLFLVAVNLAASEAIELYVRRTSFLVSRFIRSFSTLASACSRDTS